MNRKIHCLSMISVCLFIVSCAGTNIQIQTVKSSIDKERSCDLPINPSNMLALLISYKPTMRYLTNADDACRFAFADRLKKEVKSSFFMTDGCEKVTLQDIEDALHRPEVLNERLNYLTAG